MSTPLAEINRELLDITEAHAAGQLDRMSFRRRRRELICQVTGESPPVQGEEEAAAAVSEDETNPKMAAVDVPVAATADQLPEQARAPETGDDEAADEESAGKSRLSSWKLTVLLLLVAMAGLGGLLWYVLR